MTDQSPQDRSGPAMEIPLLVMLRSQLTKRIIGKLNDTSDTTIQERVLGLELEQLPYNLGSSYHALKQLEYFLGAIAIHVAATFPAPGSNTVGMTLEQTHAIAWTVDHFLDSSRRAQNAITRYLARSFRVSLPGSLSEFVSNPRHHSKIPPDVLAPVVEYWQASGSRLKAYRDLAQHHAVVSSDAFVFINPGDPPRVHLLLPSRPNDPSLARLSYDPPFVHVGEYCRSAFLSLFKTCYYLSYLLLGHVGTSRDLRITALRHPFQLGQDSFSPLPDDQVDNLLWDLRRPPIEELHAMFGNSTDASPTGTET